MKANKALKLSDKFWNFKRMGKFAEYIHNVVIPYFKYRMELSDRLELIHKLIKEHAKEGKYDFVYPLNATPRMRESVKEILREEGYVVTTPEYPNMIPTKISWCATRKA